MISTKFAPGTRVIARADWETPNTGVVISFDEAYRLDSAYKPTTGIDPKKPRLYAKWDSHGWGITWEYEDRVTEDIKLPESDLEAKVADLKRQVAKLDGALSKIRNILEKL